MSESFSATYCCISCYIAKNNMWDTTRLDGIELRTSQNFYDSFNETQEGSSQYLMHTKGVARVSELNRLHYFKIPDNLGADTFHDIEEGFAEDFLTAAINKLVETSGLSKQNLLERVQCFDFGEDRKYQPNRIDRMSGLQTRNLLFRFNFIYSDLKTDENAVYFELISLLCEIMKIVGSSKLTESDLTTLDLLIERMLNIWVGQLENRLKPKQHFLLHYTSIIRRLGPLALMETSSFERKHRFITSVFEKHRNCINILKSCTMRHQHWWSREWANISGFFVPTFSKKRPIHLSWEEIGTRCDDIDPDNDIYEVDSASFKFDYKPGLFVVQKLPNIYQFFVINNVLIQNDKIFLKCKSVETVYSQFYCSFEIINENNRSQIINLNSLHTQESFCSQKPYGKSERFILCKRNVL